VGVKAGYGSAAVDRSANVLAASIRLQRPARNCRSKLRFLPATTANEALHFASWSQFQTVDSSVSERLSDPEDAVVLIESSAAMSQVASQSKPPTATLSLQINASKPP
jgi:hypothetical protein